jgi:uncharacterized protein (TIGR02001 family)
MHNTTSKGRARRTASLFLLVLLATGAAGIFSGASAEETKGPSVSADITVASKYVWRGLVLTDDPVLQPSLTVDYKSLNLNVWGNTDLTDVNGTPGEINELDYTLSYSFAVNKVNLDLGVIQYTFPHTDFEPTTEIYGSAGLDMLLSPAVSIYYDVDEVNGLYGTLGISHSFSLGEVYKGITPSLDLSGSIGYGSSNYNEGYFGVHSSGLVDLLMTATLSVPIDEHLSVGPFVSFSQVLDSDLKDAVDKDHATFFGGTLSLAF